MSARIATDLPIEPIVPEILGALQAAPNLVLEAPPGAGKTTRVPLALLDAAWTRGQKIIVLEPRRLATDLGAQTLCVRCRAQGGAAGAEAT